MNPRVETYLNQKKAELEQKALDKINQGRWETYKQDVLICAGLYDKIYGPQKDEEYCYSELNPQTGTARYFKIVPIGVTDEEFEEIRKYSAISFNE